MILKHLDGSGGWFDTQDAFLYHSGQELHAFSAVVAQLVEQGPLKPKVLGSIPSRSTIHKNRPKACFYVCPVIPPRGILRGLLFLKKPPTESPPGSDRNP